jgi:hypothetical protein
MFGAPQFGTDYFADGLLATTPPDYNPCGSFGFGGFYLGQRPNCADVVATDAGNYIGWSGSSVDRHTASGGTTGGSFWYNIGRWLKPPVKHHKDKSTASYCVMGWSDEKLAHRHSEKSDTTIPQRSFVNKSRHDRLHIKEKDSGGFAMFALGVELARMETPTTQSRRFVEEHTSPPRRRTQSPPQQKIAPKKQSRREPILLRRMFPEQTATLPDIAIERKAAVVGGEHFETQSAPILPVNRIQRGRDSDHDLIALLIALDEI